MSAKLRSVVVGAIVFATLAGASVLSGCGKSCVYEGRTYDDGDEWACSCNTCSCNDGELGSTRLACQALDAGL
jgi:hypothetical protein